MFKILPCLALLAFLTGCVTHAAPAKVQHNPMPATDTASVAAPAKLDVLTDYDRELWGGPDAWSDEQWRWKKQLRWDRHCDYVGEVDVYPLAPGSQFITVLCVPGAYQPTYYLYIYSQNPKNTIVRPLFIGDPHNTDNPQEVNGHIHFDPNTRRLAITMLSRGIGDCGVHRVYQLDSATTPEKQIEKRQRACVNSALLENPPEEIFDPTRWPLVEINE